MGEGSPRRPRGRAGRAPGEGGEDREERKVRGDLRAKGRGRQGVREPRAGPQGMLRAEGVDVGRGGRTGMGGTIEAAKRAEGTRRRPLRVRRGTRAGGETQGKEERGERGLEQGGGKEGEEGERQGDEK